MDEFTLGKLGGGRYSLPSYCRGESVEDSDTLRVLCKVFVVPWCPSLLVYSLSLHRSGCLLLT